MNLLTLNFFIYLLLSGAAFMVIGMIWYGSIFGNIWAKLAYGGPENIDRKGMQKTYGISFVLSLIQAYVVYYILNYINISNLLIGFYFIIAVWLGFNLVPKLINGLYLKTNSKLILIDSGYHLVTSTAMVIIYILIV